MSCTPNPYHMQQPASSHRHSRILPSVSLLVAVKNEDETKNRLRAADESKSLRLIIAETVFVFNFTYMFMNTAR